MQHSSRLVVLHRFADVYLVVYKKVLQAGLLGITLLLYLIFSSQFPFSYSEFAVLILPVDLSANLMLAI